MAQPSCTLRNNGHVRTASGICPVLQGPQGREGEGSEREAETETKRSMQTYAEV